MIAMNLPRFLMLGALLVMLWVAPSHIFGRGPLQISRQTRRLVPGPRGYQRGGNRTQAVLSLLSLLMVAYVAWRVFQPVVKVEHLITYHRR